MERWFQAAADGAKWLVDKFNELVKKVTEGVQKAAKGLDGPIFDVDVDRINRVCKQITDTVQQIRDQVDAFAKVATEYAKNKAPVISLLQTSFDWLNQVQKPISSIEGRLDRPADNNFVSWQGDAASLYDKIQSQQVKSIAATHAAAKSISDWLVEISVANTEMLMGFVKLAADVAGEIAAVVIDAATYVGILEAIGKLATAIGNLIPQAATYFADSFKYYIQAVGWVQSSDSVINDESAFPRGKWPKAMK